ncbi:MAG: hypothetical protein ACR2P1_08895, partial [Pseudomonadales bacterium]
TAATAAVPNAPMIFMWLRLTSALHKFATMLGHASVHTLAGLKGVESVFKRLFLMENWGE